MEQFLRSNNLSSDNGIGVLVRRTEIKKLPPYPFYLKFRFSMIAILKILRSSRCNHTSCFIRLKLRKADEFPHSK